MYHLSLTTNNYYFGENAIDALSEILKETKVKNVMLIYGGGSIKANHGLYEKIKNAVAATGANFFEFSGIKPNPTNVQANEAADQARNNRVDLIIAAGGGSVIDLSKYVAVATTNSEFKETWDLVKRDNFTNGFKNSPVPIVSISTISGTASENNAGGVLTNEKEKNKFGNWSVAPVQYAIMDPKYTYSVSKWQTASGIFDAFSHLLETFYIEKAADDFAWTSSFLLMNMKQLIENARTVMQDPQNAKARANIMFITAFSLNPLSVFNMESADWRVHDLEHALSAKYDISHGAGLALLTPAYITIRCQTDPFFKARSEILAKELFGKTTAEELVSALSEFIEKTLGFSLSYANFKEIPRRPDEDEMKDLAAHTRLIERDLALQVLKAIP